MHPVTVTSSLRLLGFEVPPVYYGSGFRVVDDASGAVVTGPSDRDTENAFYLLRDYGYANLEWIDARSFRVRG